MSTTRPTPDGTPAAPVTPADDVPVAAQAAGAAFGTATTTAAEREFTVRAMTQRELVTRRFVRHRGALAGFGMFAFIVLLSITSIGAFGLPGWWGLSYSDPATVVDGGRMSLDVLPPFWDGDGLSFGPHPFGQDDVGRDFFALVMRGTQISLMIALLVGLIATVIGVLIGATAGYFRGSAENVLMRITDVIITIPLLIIAAVLARNVQALGPIAIAVVIGLIYWTTLGRLVRGEFLSLREKEFVEAARAMGASSSRIIFRHILPNALGTIIVSATLTVSAAILLETSLSYLGLGVQPPDTSLGLLIDAYQSSFETRPWLFWWPALFIVVIALSVNFIGDGLRDAFDPKQTRVRA
jgi:ABC-type dipeptide/oligopeptide/nickel transport system permease subunit